MPAPTRTFAPTLGDLSDAYLQDYQVWQCRSRSPAHGRTAHRTCWVRPMCQLVRGSAPSPGYNRVTRPGVTPRTMT